MRKLSFLGFGKKKESVSNPGSPSKYTKVCCERELNTENTTTSRLSLRRNTVAITDSQRAIDRQDSIQSSASEHFTNEMERTFPKFSFDDRLYASAMLYGDEISPTLYVTDILVEEEPVVAKIASNISAPSTPMNSLQTAKRTVVINTEDGYGYEVEQNEFMREKNSSPTPQGQILDDDQVSSVQEKEIQETSQKLEIVTRTTEFEFQEKIVNNEQQETSVLEMEDRSNQEKKEETESVQKEKKEKTFLTNLHHRRQSSLATIVLSPLSEYSFSSDEATTNENLFKEKESKSHTKKKKRRKSAGPDDKERQVQELIHQIRELQEQNLSQEKELNELRRFKNDITSLEYLPQELYTRGVECLCDGWMGDEQSASVLRQGLRYLRASADLGNVQAQFEYAEVLLKHSAGKKNHEAFKYLELAKQNGHHKAGIFLSKMKQHNKL